MQFSVVLKHIAKYRPDWKVSVIAGRGKHVALLGLCHRIYHDQEPEPTETFDSDVSIGWFENYSRFVDRPCSKITNCLQECFGLSWDPALARYEVRISTEASEKAADYLASIGCTPERKPVIIHYEGNTSPWKKNLRHWQAQAVCEFVIRAGRIPVILDWDNRSPLPDNERIFCPTAGHAMWGGVGTGDAAVIGALMQQAEAVVGIDSGPGKIASAVDTPALIVWKKHHPIQFHDPAPNTVHLIPHDHRSLPPCCDKSEVADWFEKHYLFTTYEGEHDLVQQALRWMGKTLNTSVEVQAPISFVLPNGIGDCVWALTKIRAIAGKEAPIDVILSGDPRSRLDARAVPFLKRFDFIRHVHVSDLSIHEDPDSPNDARGRYRYVKDGKQGCYHYLIPNAVLERGERLENWLPEYPVDWRIMDSFSWEGTERGTQLGKDLGKFVAFYLGPEAGNTSEGHNRGFLWKPQEWVELGKECSRRGCRIAVVGAEYDRSFWEKYVQHMVWEHGMKWHDFIGQTEIGETFAFLKEARAFISYQAGLAMVMHYLGQNVVAFWRPDGNSIHPGRLVSFSEQMATAWTNPDPAYQQRYLGLIYGKERPSGIIRVMEERGWLGPA